MFGYCGPVDHDLQQLIWGMQPSVVMATLQWGRLPSRRFLEAPSGAQNQTSGISQLHDSSGGGILVLLRRLLCCFPAQYSWQVSQNGISSGWGLLARQARLLGNGLCSLSRWAGELLSPSSLLAGLLPCSHLTLRRCVVGLGVLADFLLCLCLSVLSCCSHIYFVVPGALPPSLSS